MRPIIVTAFLSLDGVMEAPMWTMPYWNDEIAAFKAAETSNGQHLLLGRVTYEGFAAAWPQRSGAESGADYFNGTRKYVISTTLNQVEWNNSVLIKTNIIESIRQLKQEDGPDLVVHGSGALVQTLMQHDLVDQFRMLVYPVVLGKGARLFRDGATATLKQVDVKSLSGGVVALVYQPERN